jgi:ferredoxin
VISDECTSCLNCIDACPVKETLEVKSVLTKKTLKTKTVAIGVVVIFMAVTGLGMITGNWQNNMEISDYMLHIKNIESSTYSHPTGIEHLQEINKETSEMNINKEQTKQ